MQISMQITEDNLQVTGNPKIAILAARFNHLIVESLINGAINGLTHHGIAESNIHLYRVPGAFELPLLAQQLANRYDGCIALGAVIRGETPHFDYVAGECANGIMQVSLAKNIPIIFGVLTTDNIEQALARAGTNAGNKGFDSALNLIEMLNLLSKIQ